MVAVNVVGPSGAQCRTFTKRLTIGSDPSADLVLAHPAVAKLALALERQGVGVTAEAMGGVVALNSSRMHGMHRLGERDEIRLGPFRVSVSLGATATIYGSRRDSVAPQPAARSSSSVPPRVSTPPAPSPTISAATALTNARAKLVWGDSESKVMGELLSADVPRADAEALVRKTISELKMDARKKGLKECLIGGGMVIGGLAWLANVVAASRLPTWWGWLLLSLWMGRGGLWALVGLYRVLVAPPLYFKGTD